jgi:predicted ATP-binding protein involved in virulence
MLWLNLNIAKLEMMNFKRFHGYHSLDLLSEPEIKKNLILIGAENGMGKTSIHEANYKELIVFQNLTNLLFRYIKQLKTFPSLKCLD